MKIKKIEYVDGMQGEAVISFTREELCKLCNGLYMLSEHRENEYDRKLHTQLRVARDIIDQGVVDSLTFSAAVEIEDRACENV